MIVFLFVREMYRQSINNFNKLHDYLIFFFILIRFVRRNLMIFFRRIKSKKIQFHYQPQ